MFQRNDDVMAWRRVVISFQYKYVHMRMWCGYVQLMYNSAQFRGSVGVQNKKSKVLRDAEWSALPLSIHSYACTSTSGLTLSDVRDPVRRMRRWGGAAGESVLAKPQAILPAGGCDARTAQAQAQAVISEEAQDRANVDHGDAHAHLHASAGRVRWVVAAASMG